MVRQEIGISRRDGEKARVRKRGKISRGKNTANKGEKRWAGIDEDERK